MITSDKRVIAVPIALAQYVLGSARTVLDDGARLVLGSPTEQLAALKSRFASHKDVCCQEFDWDPTGLPEAFFREAYDRFHRLDSVLLGPELWQCDSNQSDAQIEAGARRLLRCLDASLPYISEELHVVVVAPAGYCEPAMTIAAMFLKAKFLSAPTYPTIRMTTISTTGTRALPSGPPPQTRVFIRGQQGTTQQLTKRHRARRRLVPA